ncbi:hypothetical protein VPHK392_0011 [Vibrio phage K392]
MNYEEMSDFEINKLVVELKCKGQLIKILPQKDAFDPMETGVMSSDVHIVTSSGMEQSINPCNNPSDAWPIIVDNDIEISISRHAGFKTGNYIAKSDWEREGNNNYANVISFHKNPLRAAMICFLKMNDTEQ